MQMVAKKGLDEKLKHLAVVLERHLKREEEERENWTEKDLDQFLQLQHALEKIHHLMSRPATIEHAGDEQKQLTTILKNIRNIKQKGDEAFEEERKFREKEEENLQELVEDVEEEIPDIQEEQPVPPSGLEGNLYKQETEYTIKQSGDNRLYQEASHVDNLYKPSDLYKKEEKSNIYDPKKFQDEEKAADKKDYKTKTQTEKEIEEWKKKRDETKHRAEDYMYKEGSR